MNERIARLVIEVQGAGASVELPREGVLLVGSDAAKVGLLVTGQGVASVHCAIARAKGGGWALKDLGSEFGVQINGSTVSSQRLALGDVILLGSKRLTIVDPSAPPQQTTPDPRPAAQASAPVSSSGATPAVTLAASAAAGLPQVLGGYRLLRSLGRGGTGQVYLALQESLHRQVALKVLDRRHEADTEFVPRFLDEARAAAALSHPNVVTVYYVGTDAGHHYLSMEYMAGGDLEGLLAREGPLAWRTLLDVLRDAASGLVFAESRGIVHRDLKPANLMRDDHGVVKIADLGLATQVEAQETKSDGQRLFGTPHFIAPEIVRGQRPDARSDLYSLGATAYRLLTGHTPFEGQDATAILRGALHGSFAPVTERAPDVPPGPAQLIEGLLSRDPAGRPTSAQALLAAVERLRAGQDLHPASGGQAAAAVANLPQAAPASDGILRPVVTAALVIALATAAFIGGRHLGLWGASDPADLADSAGPADSADSSGRGGDALAGTPASEDSPDPDSGSLSAAAPGTPAAPGPESAATLGPDLDSGETSTQEPAGPPADDDAQLKQLEEEARLAFLQLADRSLPPLERVSELRALAERFAGTDAAAAGNALARSLEEQAQASAVATSGASRVIDEALASLRELAGLKVMPPQPATALAAIAALESTAQFPAADAFILRRNALLVEIIDVACAHGQAQLRLADEAAASGDFDRRRILLDEYMASADLPTAETWPAATPTPGPSAEDLTRLLAVANSARLGLARLQYDRGVFGYERERRDRQALATALAAAGGLSRELRQLDLSAAARRLAGAGARMETPELAAHLESTAEDVRGAAGCFDTLAAEYLASGWRRSTIRDPRTRGGTSREALGADSQGLRVRPAGGAVESIPWSAFGGHTRALDNLFNDRLRREWNARERHDIANLLTLCAVGEALAGAAEMFQPNGGAHFTKGEAKALRDAYGYPQAWARTTESRQTLDRERSAALVLVDVLESLDAGAYARSVAGTERLLAEFGDSLLALSLSDGSEWRDPAPDPRLMPPPELPIERPDPASPLATRGTPASPPGQE